MIDWEKDEEKRKNAIAFVEATQELIDTEGLEKVSIRKIAEKSGFHNSTIYLYFKDVNQLILLASLKHFNAYSKKLAEYSSIIAGPTDKFLAIWDAFGQTVFQRPLLFRNFFFGKYSGNLTAIITQYYRLFPEEKIHYSQEIEDMYYGNDIYDRCLRILQPLTEVESTLVTSENIRLVNTIIVACLKHLLDQICADPTLDPDEINDQLIQMICYIVGIE
ncbi:MAG: TetR/AcrR family transcriptional regulator [Faecousia sp.]